MKIFLQSHDTIQPDSDFKAEATGLPIGPNAHLVFYGPTGTPGRCVTHALRDVKAGLRKLGFDPTEAEIDDAYGYLHPDGAGVAA